MLHATDNNRTATYETQRKKCDECQLLKMNEQMLFSVRMCLLSMHLSFTCKWPSDCFHASWKQTVGADLETSTQNIHIFFWQFRLFFKWIRLPCCLDNDIDTNSIKKHEISLKNSLWIVVWICVHLLKIAEPKQLHRHCKTSENENEIMDLHELIPTKLNSLSAFAIGDKLFLARVANSFDVLSPNKMWEKMKKK